MPTQHSQLPAKPLQWNSGLAMALTLIVALAPRAAQAQGTPNPPERMSYQGYLTDGNGVALATNAPKNYDVIFRIWNDQSSTTAGNRLWAEQQTVTVDKGYFSVLLGEGSPYASEPTGNLSTLFTNANASERYVEFTVKGIGTGGTDVTILPRLRLLTSPYSFLAQKALTVDGSALTSGTVADTRLSANVALRSGGNNFTGNQRITSGSFYLPNSVYIYGKNTSGTDEGFLVPRWSDNASYLNYGSGGFYIRNNASNVKMTFNAAGDVGIGTTSPGSSLDVSGGIRARGGRPGGNGSNNNGYAFSGSGDNDSGMFSTADGLIQFYNNNTERMRIDGSGNVGIGTAGPQDRLEVSNGRLILNGNSIDTSDFQGLGLQYELSSGEGAIMSSYPGGHGYLSFYTKVNSQPITKRMTITTGGYVGIGTSSPGWPLTIQNDTVAGVLVQRSDGKYAAFSRNSGGSGSNGQLVLDLNQSHWGGTYVAYDGDNNWNFPSDRKLKKDIVNAEPVLDRAMQVQVRRYRWKDSGADSKQMLGVVAQELQPLFPDLVDEIEDPQTGETNLCVGYSDFGLIAIKALQEFKQQHDAELEELKAEIAELQKVNQQLRADNEARDKRLTAIEKTLHGQQAQTDRHESSFSSTGN